MKKKDNNIEAFFALLRAGLWERDVELRNYGTTDWTEIMQLAAEQSVVGLVTAGLEHVTDVRTPQEWVLQFIGQTLQIEQQNTAMNHFIGKIMRKMAEGGIDAVLIKGQGVAQCYERPSWRSCGDVDLLLDDANYEKGKVLLKNISEKEPEEYSFNKEYSTIVDGWSLELHGSLRSGLSSSFNKGVDAVQKDICENKRTRNWELDGLTIKLPEENNDVLLVFTHFIKHFYKGGLGVRQICDWCRLLWYYKDSIDTVFFEKKIRSMKLMTEWKAFAAFAVNWLGMPVDAMPLYDSDRKWSRKADKICTFVLDVGNFGHNMDGSYYRKYPFLIRKTISMGKRVSTLARHSTLFPLQTMFYLPHVLFTGFKSAVKGE